MGANKYTAFTFVSDTHASCSKCKEIKLHSEFSKCKTYGHRKGCAYYCKKCASENSKKHHHLRMKNVPEYRDQKRNNYIKNRFGFTLEEYTKRLQAQDNKCAICGLELPIRGYFTHLDHDHKTGKIRAFLCTNCNRGLGHFQDSSELLQKASDYLKAHSSNVDEQGGYSR